MKKIFKILVIFIMCILFVSCGNDEYIDKTVSVQITNAKTSLAAAGDTTEIVFNSATNVTAHSNDSWLKVNVIGTKIEMYADANTSVSARNTTVIIKNTSDSTIVNVSQYGAVFYLGVTDDVYTNDAGSTITYELKSNMPVTISTDCDWISFKKTDDSLSITTKTNTTGAPRIGYIKYCSGTTLDSVKVVQCDAVDLDGKWNMVSKTIDDNNNLVSQSNKVTITPNISGTQITITIATNRELVADFNNGKIIISGGRSAGSYSSGSSTNKKMYYLSSFILDSENQNLTWSNSVTSTARLSSDGSFQFSSDGSWSNYLSDSFGIGVFSSSTFSESTWLGELYLFITPKFYR
jgi:hypothetical protein